MTPAQKKLFDFIRAYITEHDGVSPSFDEMKDAMGLASKSGIHRLITALKDQGYIATGRRASARQIEVLRLPSPAPDDARTLAHHIAAQPWCAASPDIVLFAIRQLRT